MIIESQFKPLWWLTNPHAQTIYSWMRHPFSPSETTTKQLELPDGDFLNLVWSRGDLGDDTPVIVLLHGLGGGLNSSYIARFMHAFKQKGCRTVLMHFRGAGKKPNRLPRAYHSGDTADLDFLIKTLNQREPDTKKAVVGVSLGGNVLLKWLGEKGSEAGINTAVAVSVPFVLQNVSNKINRGFARLYEKSLLKQLKRIFALKMEQLENPPEILKNAAKCDCFWTFDDQVTAPLNGFSHVHNYYTTSSSRQYLKHITVPTLIIHSLDDPFMTKDVVPKEDELSESVCLEWSKKGGHVGFVAGNKMGKPIFWLDQRIPEYVLERFDGR